MLSSMALGWRHFQEVPETGNEVIWNFIFLSMSGLKKQGHISADQAVRV